MRNQPNENHMPTGVTIRRLTEADEFALARLTQLDSAEALTGDLLGAEVEGRLVAAVSLASREVVADPFSRTEELRALLELRAAQLRRREQPSPRRRFALRARSNGALAGSPPGAGGKLLSLSMRSS